MAQSSKAVLAAKAAIVKSIQASEYGDVRSYLDELLPSPLWSEQVEMTHHLDLHVSGALFSYEGAVGWYYVEEGD